MYAQPEPVLLRETVKNVVVQFNELRQQRSGRVEFEGETAFCEIDLDGGCSSVQALTNFRCPIPQMRLRLRIMAIGS